MKTQNAIFSSKVRQNENENKNSSSSGVLVFVFGPSKERSNLRPIFWVNFDVFLTVPAPSAGGWLEKKKSWKRTGIPIPACRFRRLRDRPKK